MDAIIYKNTEFVKPCPFLKDYPREEIPFFLSKDECDTIVRNMSSINTKDLERHIKNSQGLEEVKSVLYDTIEDQIESVKSIIGRLHMSITELEKKGLFEHYAEQIDFDEASIHEIIDDGVITKITPRLDAELFHYWRAYGHLSIELKLNLIRDLQDSKYKNLMAQILLSELKQIYHTKNLPQLYRLRAGFEKKVLRNYFLHILEIDIKQHTITLNFLEKTKRVHDLNNFMKQIKFAPSVEQMTAIHWTFQCDLLGYNTKYNRRA